VTEIKNIYVPQSIQINETHRKWFPTPNIKCISLELSRLCYLCKLQPCSNFFNLEIGSHSLDTDDKILVFWQYLGNNLRTVQCLEEFKKIKDVCIIIDDAYEGLLTREKVDYIEEIISKVTANYFFATSNTFLTGNRIKHVNFHLMNKAFDNIRPSEHVYTGHSWGRNKKMLCVNGIPRPHRLKIVDYLIKIGAMETSYVSCKKTHTLDTVYDVDNVEDIISKKTSYNDKWNQLIETDFFDSEKTGFILEEDSKQRLKENLPLNLDLEQLPYNEKFLPSGEEYYNDSYWSIVTERDFLLSDKFRGFTEKIYKAILFKHPFIICGLPCTLEKLHQMGFVTFNGFIDESYDLIEDNQLRMNAIENEIQKLNDMTLSEHYIMRKQIEPILDYNREKYISLHETSIPNTIVTAIQQWYYST
jgi:hypothetical protein